LTLVFKFRGLRHLLFAGGLQELPAAGVSSGPDLRQKIAIAVAVEYQVGFGFGLAGDGGVGVDEGRRGGVIARNQDRRARWARSFDGIFSGICVLPATKSKGMLTTKGCCA
jgi:hypothetical protein